MKIEKLYETAKDTAERLSEISPKDRIYEGGGWIEGGSQNGAWFTGERYAHNIINDLKSGCTKWIDWNIVLDMQGGPNHVGNYCDAPILADEKTGRSQKANLSDWEKARTAANADTNSSTNPVYLKCPPRAIQTWILK